MNSTENIQEGYWDGPSKTALELKNCKQQLFTLIMCLSACLWAQDVEKRESGSMFCETIETISWSSNESSRKHENIALKSIMTKQWNSLIPQ